MKSLIATRSTSVGSSISCGLSLLVSLALSRQSTAVSIQVASFRLDNSTGTRDNKHLNMPSSLHRASFPFEKLPTELQLMVLRFAFPENGIRSLAIPLARSDPAHDATLLFWQGKLHTEDVIPTALFRTNRRISAQSLDIFKRQIHMHVDIMADMIGCLRHACSGPLWHQVCAAQQRRLGLMRSYQINIRFDFSRCSLLPADEEGFRNHQMFKEKLRHVSDALAQNANLQRLTVTIPCLCKQTKAYKGVLDILSPLKRLRVAKPVTFQPANGSEFLPDIHPCKQPACLQFARSLQTNLGHLRGKTLDHRERTWRKIKGIAEIQRSSVRRGQDLAAFWWSLEEGDIKEFGKRAGHTIRNLEFRW